jgi:hypothetical protein
LSTPTFRAIWHLDEKLVIAPYHRRKPSENKKAIYPSLCVVGTVLSKEEIDSFF